MERDVGVARATKIYDYQQCLKWCRSFMGNPVSTVVMMVHEVVMEISFVSLQAQEINGWH